MMGDTGKFFFLCKGPHRDYLIFSKGFNSKWNLNGGYALPFHRETSVGGECCMCTRVWCQLSNSHVGLVALARYNLGVNLSDQVLNTTGTQEPPLTSAHNAYSRVWLRVYCFFILNSYLDCSTWINFVVYFNVYNNNIRQLLSLLFIFSQKCFSLLDHIVCPRFYLLIILWL
jgi:hypothetical protein